jgi:hypothetical protein
MVLVADHQVRGDWLIPSVLIALFISFFLLAQRQRNLIDVYPPSRLLKAGFSTRCCSILICARGRALAKRVDVRWIPEERHI